MSVFHERAYLGNGDVAIVDCGDECRVMLMTDANYSRYQRGMTYFCRHEFRPAWPVSLAAPTDGFWNIVLEFDVDVPKGRHSVQIVHNS